MTAGFLISAEVDASATKSETDGVVEANAERSGSKRTREERKRKETFMLEAFMLEETIVDKGIFLVSEACSFDNFR